MNISSFLIGYQAGKNAGGGGGSSADVRYVTFMSYDGAEEYGRLPVATGYDCPNPKFTVTRESTAQYNFVHDAWATEPNGATDANALKAITEDRVVYATFISVLRYYTITYLDTDGSVLESKSWAYGETPTITDPAKSGFSFDGWEPAIAAVTGDATYTAKWVEAITFAGGSWEDIIRIVEAGEAQKYFAVGDTKPFVFTAPDGTEMSTTLQIVDFGVDQLADGSGYAGISIMTNTATFEAQHTTASYTEYNWENSPIRASLNGSVYESFPAALRNGIKSVTKLTREYVDGTDLTGMLETTEKVWLPSALELKSGNDHSGYSFYPEKTSEGALNYSGTLYGSTIISEKWEELLAEGVINEGGDAYLLTRSECAKAKYKSLCLSKNGTQSKRWAKDAVIIGYITFGFCI